MISCQAAPETARAAAWTNLIVVRPVQTRRCVVIGAGVPRAAAAAGLAPAGRGGTLLEAARPAQGTSRWSFAWVNSNDKGPKAYHDLNQAGIRAWAELAPGLDGAARDPPGRP